MFSDSPAFIQSRHLIPASARAIRGIRGRTTRDTAVGQTSASQSLQDRCVVLPLRQARLRNLRTCDCQLRGLILGTLTRVVGHASQLVRVGRSLHHLLSRGTTIHADGGIAFDDLGLVTRITVRAGIQKLLLVLQVAPQPFTVGGHLCGGRKKRYASPHTDSATGTHV